MEKNICQSCAMFMKDDSLSGTNSDGSKSEDYCCYCLKEGDFIGYQTLEEAIADSVNFAEHAGMTKEEMLKHAKENYPNLKRWRKQ